MDVEASHFQQSEQLYEALVSGDWFGEPIRDVLILASEPISWPVGVWLPKPLTRCSWAGQCAVWGWGIKQNMI
ncbi:hypothetical protein JCM19232_1588 [Vibrio ishigakensis]|uniref:Uncharacterized protein n=1 Tax=Vibrio ishigakensis TaxID=1481914 RepID=A0A0B8PIF9_9VIBR|nr:hypothetical protein JCM19232_1588 [Vibrio ishigakensis]